MLTSEQISQIRPIDEFREIYPDAQEMNSLELERGMITKEAVAVLLRYQNGK